MPKKPNPLKLTDKELYYVCLSLESHLTHRDTFFTAKSRAIFNRLINKVIKNGMERENPKSILHPIAQFEEDEME